MKNFWCLENTFQFSSFAKSHLTLWDPHELQQARLPCPSPSPKVCSNLCPLSRWCHPTISYSVKPSPALNISQHQGLFQLVDSASAGQSIGVSASVFPMNIQGWFHLGLTGLSSLQSKELSTVSSNTTVQKNQFFSSQPSLWSSSHIWTWLLEKP